MQTGKEKRNMAVDLMKGIAILMIIWHHFDSEFELCSLAPARYGQMGCQIFFVLSGYCAALVYERVFREQEGRMLTSWKTFFFRRLASLAPAWYVMILVLLLVNLLSIRVMGRTMLPRADTSLTGILCNLLFLNGLVPQYNNNVIPGGWYIGTTVVLYFVTPFLYRLIFGNRSGKMATALCILVPFVILEGAALVLPAYSGYLTDKNSFGYFSAAAQLPCFALGLLAYRDEKSGNTDAGYGSWIAAVTALVLSVVLYFCPCFTGSALICSDLTGFAAYWFLKAMTPLFGEQRQKAEEKHCGNNPVLQFLCRMGKKSYMLYLVHTIFAFSMTAAIRMLLLRIGAAWDTYLLYIPLFLVELFLTCITGLVLERLIGEAGKLLKLPQRQKK